VFSVIRIAKSNKVLLRKPPNKAAKRVPVKDWRSLAHTKWECKYHVVIVAKYRMKFLYGNVKRRTGQILRELCQYKDIELLERHAVADPYVYIGPAEVQYSDGDRIFEREKRDTDTPGNPEGNERVYGQKFLDKGILRKHGRLK
jgi:hypothetical protein